MKSEFYLKKIQNEKKLIETEYAIRNEFNSFISTKGLLKHLLKLPFTGSSKEKEAAVEKTLSPASDNLIQDGIQLYHSVKEITALSKHIINRLKA